MLREDRPSGPLGRVLAALTALALLVLTGCGAGDRAAREPYGVFLSVTEDLQTLEGYETVVVDAQYFSREEIAAFREGGHRVYSYLNLGSLETFRPYYERFRDLALAPYEHWEEEVWLDVTNAGWQSFLLEELVPDLLQRGVDGFFVDNCDVYGHYPTQDVLEALTAVMSALVDTGKAVLINGGDTYLDAYCAAGGRWQDVITCINQESVFSTILWETGELGTARSEDRAYFLDYVERYGGAGADIYLLEYTRSGSLKKEIADYCREKGFTCYISDSVELDG